MDSAKLVKLLVRQCSLTTAVTPESFCLALFTKSLAKQMTVNGKIVGNQLEI